MNRYLIKFKIKGEWKKLILNGKDMETVLAQAKENIKKDYKKMGSILIERIQDEILSTYYS